MCGCSCRSPYSHALAPRAALGHPSSDVRGQAGAVVLTAGECGDGCVASTAPNLSLLSLCPLLAAADRPLVSAGPLSCGGRLPAISAFQCRGVGGCFLCLPRGEPRPLTIHLGEPWCWQGSLARSHRVCSRVSPGRAASCLLPGAGGWQQGMAGCHHLFFWESR